MEMNKNEKIQTVIQREIKRKEEKEITEIECFIPISQNLQQQNSIHLKLDKNLCFQNYDFSNNESIINNDRRLPVNQSLKWPYSPIGLLKIYFSFLENNEIALELVL